MVRGSNLVDSIGGLGDKKITRITPLLTRGKRVDWHKGQMVNLPSTISGNMVFVIGGVMAVSHIGREGSQGSCMPVFPGGFLNVGPESDSIVDQSIYAVTDVNAVIVSNQICTKWMTDDMESATAMLEYFHAQSMLFTDTLKVVGAQSVQERAIGFIEQYTHFNEPTLVNKLGRMYNWQISQQGFSTLIGTNRSHLSVVLGKLRESGEAIISSRTLQLPTGSSIGT